MTLINKGCLIRHILNNTSFRDGDGEKSSKVKRGVTIYIHTISHTLTFSLLKSKYKNGFCRLLHTMHVHVMYLIDFSLSRVRVAICLL